MGESARRLTISLVLAVVAVDAVFVGIYFFAGLRFASDGVKAVFTVIWTLITLAVIVRGLARIQGARMRNRSV